MKISYNTILLKYNEIEKEENEEIEKGKEEDEKMKNKEKEKENIIDENKDIKIKKGPNEKYLINGDVIIYEKIERKKKKPNNFKNIR